MHRKFQRIYKISLRNNEFSRMEGHKVSIHKSPAFLYASNEQLKFSINLKKTQFRVEINNKTCAVICMLKTLKKT